MTNLQLLGQQVKRTTSSGARPRASATSSASSKSAPRETSATSVGSVSKGVSSDVSPDASSSAQDQDMQPGFKGLVGSMAAGAATGKLPREAPAPAVSTRSRTVAGGRRASQFSALRTEVAAQQQHEHEAAEAEAKMQVERRAVDAALSAAVAAAAVAEAGEVSGGKSVGSARVWHNGRLVPASQVTAEASAGRS